MTSIPELERKKQDIHKAFSRAQTAIEAGTITLQERDAFLQHAYGSTDERRIIAAIDQQIARLRSEQPPAHHPATLVAGFFLLMVALFATLFWSTGGITGAVVLDIVLDTAYTENATVNLTLNGTTRVTVSGSAQGLGDAILTLRMADGREYLLYAHRYAGAATPHASLAKSRYEEGEIVTYSASNVSSAYLMTAEEAVPLGNATAIENLTAGSYTIKLIINDTGLTQEELPFEVVPAGTAPPLDVFSACGAACKVNLTGDATLEITITGDATITVGTINLSTQGNRAPQQIAQIPDMSGKNATIDLGQYFEDPDGDELLYDVSDEKKTEEQLEGGMLIITGPPGTYEYYVYASDLQELIQSNRFVVTIPAQGRMEQNESANATGEQNATANSTQNSTNGSSNLTTAALCDHPDPNRRPIECLQAQAAEYFPEEDIFWETPDRTPAGKFNQLGNLLIRGDVIEYSAAVPGPRDFVIGSIDRDGNVMPAAWVDSEGNLHVKGILHEEALALVPPPGSYSVLSRRSIYLAYVDYATGDLYLRGNVIPYRRSLR